jgi:hydrogenase 3 maturation protease
MDWKQKIVPLIRQTRKIVLLGIGNELMGDDGAGSRIASDLKASLPERRKTKVFRIINASTAPENFTGVIKAEDPDLILMIDSVDSGERAGVVTVQDSRGMHSPIHSTHTLPLSSLAQYLEQTTRAKVVALGIQAKTVNFGSPMSREVLSSVQEVVHVLKEALSGKEFLNEPMAVSPSILSGEGGPR